MDEFSIEQKIEDLENQLRELKKSLKKSNHLVSDYIFPQTAMIEGVKFSSINEYKVKRKVRFDAYRNYGWFEHSRSFYKIRNTLFAS